MINFLILNYIIILKNKKNRNKMVILLFNLLFHLHGLILDKNYYYID